MDKPARHTLPGLVGTPEGLNRMFDKCYYDTNWYTAGVAAAEVTFRLHKQSFLVGRRKFRKKRNRFSMTVKLPVLILTGNGQNYVRPKKSYGMNR